jgi:hypothetical protein
MMAQSLLPHRNLNLASRERPHRGGEILELSWVNRSPKTTLDDVEPKRGDEVG